MESTSPSRGDANLFTALRELDEIEVWARQTKTDGYPRSFISANHWSGPAFHVRTASCNAMHEVVGISAGRPEEAEPSEAECAALRSVVRAMLDLVGHEAGPSFTRVLLTAQGLRIAEIRLEADPGGCADADSPRGGGDR